jgi:hypothetical protein
LIAKTLTNHYMLKKNAYAGRVADLAAMTAISIAEHA